MGFKKINKLDFLQIIMITEEAVVKNIADIPIVAINEISKLGSWLQALGTVVVLTIIFEIIAFFLNRKRLKEIAIIKIDMKRIERKIDKILRRGKNS